MTSILSAAAAAVKSAAASSVSSILHHTGSGAVRDASASVSSIVENVDGSGISSVLHRAASTAASLLYTKLPNATMPSIPNPTSLLPTGTPEPTTFLSGALAHIAEDTWLEAVYKLGPSEWAFLVPMVLIPAVYFYATYQQAEVEEVAGKADDVKPGYELAWLTARSHLQLVALTEQYVYKAIPWGPWDASSLQALPGKRFLKRLIRAGIIPISISEGGLRLYSRPAPGPKNGWNYFSRPTYVQSKGRAYFEFLVLYPGALNNKRRAFMENLFDGLHIGPGAIAGLASYFYTDDKAALGQERSHFASSRRTSWEMSTRSLEVGAESRFKWLLPFKRDVVIKEGDVETETVRGKPQKVLHLDRTAMGNAADHIPLLKRTKTFAVVRMEAPNSTPVRLDERVFQVAVASGMSDEWKEDQLSLALGDLYDSLGIEYEAWKTV